MSMDENLSQISFQINWPITWTIREQYRQPYSFNQSDPVLLIGQTSVLVRLPKNSHWPGNLNSKKSIVK